MRRHAEALAVVTLALSALPGLCVLSEQLDLSLFENGEPPEAAGLELSSHWNLRADGTDWRMQEDGSVIVTISATGDVTIGGDTRKKGRSIFDKQLEEESLGLDFPLSNVRNIFEADDLTLVNF